MTAVAIAAASIHKSWFASKYPKLNNFAIDGTKIASDKIAKAPPLTNQMAELGRVRDLSNPSSVRLEKIKAKLTTTIVAKATNLA